MSDLQSFASAVVRDGQVDVTAALVLADYLEEHGDSRGTRLRRRAKMYEKRVAELHQLGAQFFEVVEFITELTARQLGQPVAHEAKLVEVEFITELEQEFRLNQEKDGFLSYFFRLLSVGWSDPLPRWTVNGAWWLIEPGVKHAAEVRK